MIYKLCERDLNKGRIVQQYEQAAKEYGLYVIDQIHQWWDSYYRQVGNLAVNVDSWGPDNVEVICVPKRFGYGDYDMFRVGISYRRGKFIFYIDIDLESDLRKGAIELPTQAVVPYTEFNMQTLEEALSKAFSSFSFLFPSPSTRTLHIPTYSEYIEGLDV